MDKSILDKYWEGETTLQEEAEILRQMQSMQEDDGLYFNMIAAARKEKSKLTFSQQQAYNQAHQPPVTETVVRPLYRWVASAAAVVMFAIAAFGVWKYSHTTATTGTLMAETYEDPYEAYEEVRDALAFVSSKLNKSQGEAIVNIKKAGEYADMFK